MKLTKLFLFPIIFPGTLLAQYSQSEQQLLQAARQIMNSTEVCTLITLDLDGLPAARTMQPFAPEDDFVVWLGTNLKSAKVQQIKNNTSVVLHYLDADASGYVAMHGKAELVDDEALKQRWWREQWEAFYPNRKDYLLIKITPERMKVVSNKLGILGDSITWKAAEVKLDRN